MNFIFAAKSILFNSGDGEAFISRLIRLACCIQIRPDSGFLKLHIKKMNFSKSCKFCKSAPAQLFLKFTQLRSSSAQLFQKSPQLRSAFFEGHSAPLSSAPLQLSFYEGCLSSAQLFRTGSQLSSPQLKFSPLSFLSSANFFNSSFLIIPSKFAILFFAISNSFVITKMNLLFF